MPTDKGNEGRRSPRVPIKARIKFKPVAETSEALSVNLSQTGIRFNTATPLKILMKVQVGKTEDVYLARLVWAKRQEDGSMSCGFEYDMSQPLTDRIRFDE